MPTDLKPSTATPASALTGPELVPCTQGGASVVLTPAQIAAYIASIVLARLDVDNLRFDGNTISTTDANGLLDLTPNGSGQVRVPFGTRAAPGLAFTAASTRGIYGANGGTHFAVGGTDILGIDSTSGGAGGAILRNSAILGWSSGNPDSNGPDAGISRVAAGVQVDTDGVAGLGYRLTGRVVEASTAGSGAPNLLAAIESRKLLTNEGSTAEAYHTLPLAAAGIEFVFYCQDTDGIRVVANTGDTIRIGASVSAAGGFVRSSTSGSVLILVAINSTEWVAISVVGTWTVDV